MDAYTPEDVNRHVTDDEILDDLHARHGDGWDDETDTRTRYGNEPLEAYDEGTPRVERITRRGASHLPGQAWGTTECLCDCHFGVRDSSGMPACDIRECRAWGVQNAAKAAKANERAQAKADRKRTRRTGGAA